MSAQGTEVAKTRAWADERNRLLQFKARVGKFPGSNKAPGNAGNWVYQSLPVNISGNGTYELLFGPLDQSFDFPKDPTAVAFDFPWDIHFTILPSGGVTTVSIDGKRYFKVEASVTRYKQPYQGLTAWIY
jgi:hypothetical protein